MLSFSISDHKIGELVQDDIVKIAKDSLGKKEDEIIELERKLYYVSQLIYPCFEIQNKFEDFHQSYLLLSKYPNGKKYRDNFSRENYIIYHLQFYLISQVALFDRLLHLVNFVYEIGLDDKNVRYSVIVKNSRVDKNTKNALKRFNKYLDEINVRMDQNRIKHKERLKDKKLFTPSLFEYSAKIKGNLDEATLDELKRSAMGMYKVYIYLKRHSMKSEIECLNEMTTSVLDTLYPHILKKYNSFT